MQIERGRHPAHYHIGKTVTPDSRLASYDLRLLIGLLPDQRQRRDQHPADGIAENDRPDEPAGLQGHDAGRGEVEHIRDGMLIAA